MQVYVRVKMCLRYAVVPFFTSKHFPRSPKGYRANATGAKRTTRGGPFRKFFNDHPTGRSLPKVAASSLLAAYLFGVQRGCREEANAERISVGMHVRIYSCQSFRVYKLKYEADLFLV